MAFLASLKPRRGRAPLAALPALCALAAGVQALAPASAGAVANQLTDCEPTAVPGIGINIKTGVDCILAGSGIEVVEIEGSPVLCPTPSNCLAKGPLYLGGGGGEAGNGSGPVTSPGQVAKAKPKKQATKAKEPPKPKETSKADPRKLCNVTLARGLYQRQKEFGEFLERASADRSDLLFHPPWPEGSDSEPEPMTVSEVEKLAKYVRTLRTMKANDPYPPTITLPLDKDLELKAIGQEFWRSDCKQFRASGKTGG